MNKNNQRLNELSTELVNLILDVPVAKDYLKIYEAMEHHDRIKGLIRSQKHIQKQMVQAKKIMKKNALQLYEMQLIETKEALHAIPLYQQYLTALAELQEYLNVVSTHINQIINFEDIDL